MSTYKALSAFEQVKLQIKNQSMQAEIDRLMLEFCPERMDEQQIRQWEASQRAAGDNVHDQIATYWEHVCPAIVDSEEAINRLETEDDDYLFLLIIASIVFFFLGFVVGISL